jgi:hypothetical protein
MGQPPDPAIAPGQPSVSRRQQQLQSALSRPLTPTEMYEQIVKPQRGFLSSPGNANDTLRQKPATVSIDPKGIGSPVGKGYETFAAIQVLDKDNRRVAVGADFFDSGGLDNHAEARAIKGLERDGPINVAGGKLVVVTEKDLCASCEARVTEYARKRGIGTIEVHIPERASIINPAKTVTGKQAARTAFQGERPTLTMKFQRTIRVAGVEHIESIPEPPVTSVRTAVTGTLANIVAGVVLGIFQQKFKAEMQESLAKMPKPQVDKRKAAEYLSDPNTGRALRTIDLLNKNLPAFRDDLQTTHDQTMYTAALELGLIQLSRMPDTTRLQFLNGLEDQLNIRADELLVVSDNLDATAALEPKALDAAKSAEDLANLIDRAIVADFLLQQGFEFNEIVTMYENLKSFSSRVRSTFTQIRALKQTVDACLKETQEKGWIANRLYWQISLSNIAEELKKRGVQ